MPATYTINPEEVELKAIRAQGPGGQNVNKLSSAVQLRFDVAASSLPAGVKDRLLAVRDHRITDEGVVVIKAQTHSSQDRNREGALERLAELVNSVAHAPEARRPNEADLRLASTSLEGQGRAVEDQSGTQRV